MMQWLIPQKIKKDHLLLSYLVLIVENTNMKDVVSTI